MSRIVDITDLVDDSSDADSDDDIIGHNSGMGGLHSNGLGMGSMKVRTKMESGGGLSSFRNKKSRGYGPGGAVSSLMCRQVVILVALVGVIIGASVAIGFAVLRTSPDDAIPSVGANVASSSGGQDLLMIAERIVTSCSETKLNEDMTECQQLCHANMCCFESGEYNCENDESKNCAAHAGCEALVDGGVVGGSETDEE